MLPNYPSITTKSRRQLHKFGNTTMIIDIILDRKSGHAYKPEDITKYGNEEVNKQFATGNNDYIQQALCRYLCLNDYNPQLCGYILSKDWTQPEAESPFHKWYVLVRALEHRDMSILCMCGLEDTTTNGLIFDMACNQWHHDEDRERRGKLLNDYGAVLESID